MYEHKVLVIEVVGGVQTFFLRGMIDNNMRKCSRANPLFIQGHFENVKCHTIFSFCVARP